MGPVPTDYLIELGGGMRPPLGCLFNSTLVDGRQRETALKLPCKRVGFPLSQKQIYLCSDLW